MESLSAENPGRLYRAVVEQRKRIVRLRTPQAFTLSIHDPAVFEAYEERKAAIRNLEGF